MSGDRSMMLGKQPIHMPELEIERGNPGWCFKNPLPPDAGKICFSQNQIRGGSWLPCWGTSPLFVPSRKGAGGDWENRQSWKLGHV